ncbi:hypothetical protein D3C78_1822130 [compost metagenome]
MLIPPTALPGTIGYCPAPAEAGVPLLVNVTDFIESSNISVPLLILKARESSVIAVP